LSKQQHYSHHQHLLQFHLNYQQNISKPNLQASNYYYCRTWNKQISISNWHNNDIFHTIKFFFNFIWIINNKLQNRILKHSTYHD
jgi:hypothetical protein